MIPKQYHRDILIDSFRYTLGRSTYAPHTIVELLLKVWPDLSEGDRVLYVREIKEAIDDGMAGMNIDVRAWQSVLDYAEKFEETK